MSRNNEDRLGQPVPASTDAVAATTAPAPQPSMDLDFPVPTELVDLPSEGKYYPEDHPLHDQDTIEIKHMTAAEENILASRTLIKKGVVIDKLRQKIVVDKKIQIESIYHNNII